MTDRTRRVTIAVVLGVAVIAGFLVWSGWKNADYTVVSTGWQQGSSSPVAPTLAKGSTASTAKVDPETGLPWIDVADLPSQGRQVLALIDKGGPYPYDQDGGTFSNAERLLPIKAKGFYTEYTVKLPSSSDRGPLRIIMGGRGQWFFWTNNHYASFTRIRR